jgi:23S rRNA (uracil1939-C5)-methyltransferase
MKTLVAQIEKFSHDARGIARINGKITFIDGALPGERVRYVLTKQKKQYDEARLIEVLETSPSRVPPRCPYYGECGGCSLQHLDWSAQVQVKQAQVLDVLQRIAGLAPNTIVQPLVSTGWQYRDKARFTGELGFKKKYQSKLTQPIDECSILNPHASRVLRPLRACLNTLAHPEQISSIEIAVGEEAVALIFRLKGQINTQPLLDFAQTHGIRLLIQIGSQAPVQLIYPANTSDDLTYSLPAYQLTMAFHPTDFTQINPAVNRLMVEQALNLLTLNPHDVVLDLFCGIGNFTLPIAQHCQKAIGIEGLPALVARAAANAASNGIDNAEFYCGDLERIADIQRQYDLKINKLLLDPPRTGALAVVQQIKHLNPERLVYVSCDPATFARDAAVLTAAGYELSTLGVMDMFPQTTHVETMALFIRHR